MGLISHQKPVQEAAYQDGTCYGCGPANPDGLHLKSYMSKDGDKLTASFDPADRFNAGIPNVAYGGLIASLIDCQSMWTAITFAHLDEDRPLTDDFIWYVTAELNVEFQGPTPLDQPIHLQSWVEGESGPKTRVTCELGPEETVTAVGDVLAVRRST